MNHLMIVMFLRDRDSRMRRIRRTLRDASDPFTITDTEFQSFYRLTKEGVQALIVELRPLLPNPNRSHGVPVELQVLIALNFFASGSYQARVGQNFFTCVSQPTVSKILRNVVDGLNILMQDWIQFPIEEREIQDIKEKFFSRTRFPGVIGAIDGTHVAIVPPNKEREHLYFNRRYYHSMNVLLVCDYEGKILTVNAAHGGRTHDSRVWIASRVSSHLREMYEAGRRDSWLLGDSGYSLLPYLMTPKLRTREGTPSARYTDCHVRARSCVERCIGVLKGRWRCLKKERTLHYTPEVAARIVNAVCVLHNMAVKSRLEEPELHFDEIDNEPPIERQDLQDESGNVVRERIINQYFRG